jgi:hypothetical protein
MSICVGAVSELRTDVTGKIVRSVAGKQSPARGWASVGPMPWGGVGGWRRHDFGAKPIPCSPSCFTDIPEGLTSCDLSFHVCVWLMFGRVFVPVRYLQNDGDEIHAGQPFVEVEAMKMIMPLKVRTDGTNTHHGRTPREMYIPFLVEPDHAPHNLFRPGLYHGVSTLSFRTPDPCLWLSFRRRRAVR